MHRLLGALIGVAIQAVRMAPEYPWYLLRQTILPRDAKARFKDRVAFGRPLSGIANDGCAVAVVQLYDAPAAKLSRARLHAALHAAMLAAGTSLSSALGAMRSKSMRRARDWRLPCATPTPPRNCLRADRRSELPRLIGGFFAVQV